MTERVSVAEAKKRLSELMSRVVYSGDRFIIERKGRPMVALIAAADLETYGRLEPPWNLREDPLANTILE